MLKNKGFNEAGFYRALEDTVKARDLTWKQVAVQTGVSASTLARMAKGRQPDAASLAALSAWAGLNPSSFVATERPAPKVEPMVQIATLLRNDPNLGADAAAALAAIVKTAYDQLKKEKASESDSDESQSH